MTVSPERSKVRGGRRYATVIQDDAPVACLTVFRFKLGGILEVDNERGVRDREGTIVVIGTRSETGNGELPWCDGRCVQDPGTYSPQHADLRLLAIPASCRRVAAYNPN